jgi:hypothetical protein
MHTPSAIDEGKLTVLDKLSRDFFNIWRLFIPPHAKERHFNVGKFAFWIPL